MSDPMFQTKLPSSSNLTIRASIMDTWGASATFTFSEVNVTKAAPSEIGALLTSTLSMINQAATINNTVFSTALLLVAGA